jgi:hypothetical protein
VKRRDSPNVTARAFAAEFPNDNSELHAGTIWMCTEVCGTPQPHFAAPLLELECERVPEPDPTLELDETSEPIEIVESIVLEGPVEVVPAPASPPSAPLAVEAQVATAVEVEGAEPEPVVAPIEAEGALAVAPSSAPQMPVEFTEPEPLALEETLAEDASDDDPYTVFIRKLAEVAVAAGATMDAASIDALLGTDAVATAWRAILRGESEDFSTCRGALDEWAATALASMMSAPHKLAQIRRELRARGVAAFGLIEAA